MEQDVRILKEAIIARVARVTDYRVVQYAQVWLQSMRMMPNRINLNSKPTPIKIHSTLYERMYFK